MFDDAISANNNGGVGRYRQIMGMLRGAFHRLLRKSQVTVMRLIDWTFVHCSLQSMSTGISPALSYRA